MLMHAFDLILFYGWVRRRALANLGVEVPRRNGVRRLESGPRAHEAGEG